MFGKIETSKAPVAVGPYSQGIKVERHQEVVVIPLKRPVETLGEGIKAQTREVIEHIEMALAPLGRDLHSVVRMEVFLQNMERDYAGMNEEYSRWFGGAAPPARQALQRGRMGEGIAVEMVCSTAIDTAHDTLRELIFVSGQVPLDPVTGKLIEGAFEEQASRVFHNVQGVLEAGGATWDDATKVEVFLTDVVNDWDIAKNVFALPLPYEVIEVEGLPLGVPVEMSCQARIELAE